MRTELPNKGLCSVCQEPIPVRMGRCRTCGNAGRDYARVMASIKEQGGVLPLLDASLMSDDRHYPGHAYDCRDAAGVAAARARLNLLNTLRKDAA